MSAMAAALMQNAAQQQSNSGPPKTYPGAQPPTFGAIGFPMLSAPWDIKGWSGKAQNFSLGEYMEACAMFSKIHGAGHDYVLTDSGANYHIFNDRKWFTGFNDLQPYDVEVATGNGAVGSSYTGTASFETLDDNGDKVLVICQNALLIETCPFCIISQTGFSSSDNQGIASFFNLSCYSPFKSCTKGLDMQAKLRLTPF